MEVQRPLPPRYPAFPKGGSSKAVREWVLKCSEILEHAEEDPLDYPPIFAKPKDLQTTKAVTSLTDQRMILSVAASVVNISSIAPDGTSVHYTGFIFADNDSKHAGILTCSKAVCDHEGNLLVGHKLLVRLPDERSWESHLLFYNHYYNMALLEIPEDIPLPYQPFASSLKSGDKVFILSRDEELTLMTRSCTISFSEEPYLDCDCYLYLDGQLPKCGSGGLVINKDGNISGMSLGLGCSKPAVLTSSIILKCIEMERRFSCIARPVLAMALTTVELLDLSKKDKLIRDYGIDNGYVVNEVSINSDAEMLGIRRGDVITSFDGMSSLTLPELEEHLLSLGWEYLERNNSSCNAVLTLQFCDLQGHYGRSIDWPVGFTCSRLGMD